jgi:hypothetical protein
MCRPATTFTLLATQHKHTEPSQLHRSSDRCKLCPFASLRQPAYPGSVVEIDLQGSMHIGVMNGWGSRRLMDGLMTSDDDVWGIDPRIALRCDDKSDLRSRIVVLFVSSGVGPDFFDTLIDAIPLPYNVSIFATSLWMLGSDGVGVD